MLILCNTVFLCVLIDKIHGVKLHLKNFYKNKNVSRYVLCKNTLKNEINTGNVLQTFL